MECGKKTYRSFVHAKWDAKQMRRKYDEPEEAYYCRKCQGWHVGAHHVGKLQREGKRGQHIND